MTQKNKQLNQGDRKNFGFSDAEIVVQFTNPFNGQEQVLALDHTNKKPLFGQPADFTDTAEMFMVVVQDFGVDFVTAAGLERYPAPLAVFKLSKNGTKVSFEQTVWGELMVPETTETQVEAA